MRGLAHMLEREGYRTLNLDYRSNRAPLETLAEEIHPAIAAFAASFSGAVHFVGYSMGGLLIRAYITRHRPANLGRVVMLGSPNQGSEVADFVQNWRLYRRIYGPAGQQLVTRQQSFAALFGVVDYPLGILAGTSGWLDPLGSALIRAPNDGKVSVASTKLPGMRDHRTLRVTHTFFPHARNAWREVLHFLKMGRFS